jgi:hypothetical protein
MSSDGRKNRAIQSARAILAAAGLDVALAYGAFLVLALVPSLVAADGFLDTRITLADLLGGHATPAEAVDAGIGGALLVLLVTATIAVPYVWKHRLAPLAFAGPFLATALGLWPLYRQQQAQKEAFQALAEFGLSPDQLALQMEAAVRGPLDQLGIGAWLLFATVIFLAFKGVTRALARR